MGELLIPVFIVISAPTVMFSPGVFIHLKSSGLIGRFWPAILAKMAFKRSLKGIWQYKRKGVNCRVQLKRREKGNRIFDAFVVQIRGTIPIAGDADYASIRILISDVTGRTGKAKSVQTNVKKGQTKQAKEFCYEAELGRLTRSETVVLEWIDVADIETSWLVLPRKGRRKLKFITSILSCQSSKELAFASCKFAYQNSELGYIDLQENTERAKSMAVALAFAVSAADRKLYDCELEVVKDWARINICTAGKSGRAKRKLEQALNKTIDFFRDGNQLNIYKICSEIIEIAPIWLHYDILELCLRVAGANGIATTEELRLLTKLASWLEVDIDRFRRMMEKILPADMHEVKDMQVLLGVCPDMSMEDAREHLNKEYRKWHARVTNLDPEVKAQADYMLKFIADARSERIR